jgi:DNA end-binding protein Ku
MRLISMARPYWSGQVQISLVSFGVKLFVATEAKSEIRFHQIDRKSGERVRHQKVLSSSMEEAPDEAAAPVEKNQIVKGYEYAKGQYVTIEPEELDHLRVPSKHTMEVTQFVDQAEIAPEYFEKPYFCVPESDAQIEAFATVRRALIDTGKAALSKIAFAGREHIVAIVPAGSDEHPGMMLYTMRYGQELRNPADYFRDVRAVAVSDDSLELAKELIKRRAGHFDPSKFVDGYEVALKELVEAKVQHTAVPQDVAPPKKPSNVVNLMDALRRSVAGGEVAEESAAKGSTKPAASAGGRRRAVATKDTKAAGAATAKGPTLVQSDEDTTSKAGKEAAKTTARRKSA